MMVRVLAILFGIAFIFVGVAGFLSQFVQDGLLFGYFEVSVMHNLLHMITGVIAIMAATNPRYARLFFQIFGIIYAILAIVGFARGGDLSFIMLHFNLADNILHIVIAVVALFIGFSAKTEIR